jgi:hypothetical protein
MRPTRPCPCIQTALEPSLACPTPVAVEPKHDWLNRQPLKATGHVSRRRRALCRVAMLFTRSTISSFVVNAQR